VMKRMRKPRWRSQKAGRNRGRQYFASKRAIHLGYLQPANSSEYQQIGTATETFIDGLAAAPSLER
jgi:hypothetical protein